MSVEIELANDRSAGGYAVPGCEGGVDGYLVLLRRASRVAFQQPAEPLLAVDVLQRQDVGFSYLRVSVATTGLPGLDQRLIIQRLMWPLVMVVGEILATKIIHVPQAEDEEPIEAFPADRLDEPLDEGVGIGRTVGVASRFDAKSFEFRIEALGELGVAIMLE